MLRQRVPFLAAYVLMAALFLPVGCSHGPLRDDSLVLDVQPVPLKRGERALATVNAPLDALEVVGKVRVMGSPEAVFRKDPRKKIWYFSGIIPFSPWVSPGLYKLRVTVTLPEGSRVYTEVPVDLR